MIGVIADDLTGAAELGGVAWRYGLGAEICTCLEGSFKSAVGILDTDSRECAPDEAARRAAQAASLLAAQQPAWIYKKVDSVLRGPVLAELQAMLKTLGLARAVLSPANPDLGRVIRDGNYFVGGQPLDQTDFRNDPHYPRTSSRVLDLLGAEAARCVTVRKPTDHLPERGIVVAEVASRDDLRAWAAKLDETVLAAGGAEFFTAILESKGHKLCPRESGHDPKHSGRALFVCGSAAASAVQFIAGCRLRGLPVIPMPSELLATPPCAEKFVERWAEEAAAACVRHNRVVLAIDKPVLPDRNVARRLGEHLVAAARALLGRTAIDHVYVEGGATAIALARAMGWRRMEVVSELSPGVVTMRTGTDNPTSLTIKPGSYTWPAALVRGNAEVQRA